MPLTVTVALVVAVGVAVGYGLGVGVAVGVERADDAVDDAVEVALCVGVAACVAVGTAVDVGVPEGVDDPQRRAACHMGKGCIRREEEGGGEGVWDPSVCTKSGLTRVPRTAAVGCVSARCFFRHMQK